MGNRINSHTISHAENIFSGDAYTPGAQSDGRGIPRLGFVEADLGTPAVADPDGYFTALALPLGALTLTGVLVSLGVGTADVARTVQAVSDNAGDTTQVLTITGTDIYGTAVRQTLTLSGTTAVSTTKAFKTITAISSSATSTGLVTIGTGTALGLPFRLGALADVAVVNENNLNRTPTVAAPTAVALTDSTGGTASQTLADVPATYNEATLANQLASLADEVNKLIIDLAARAAGTFVVGDTTTATAATGDVRGTYDPVEVLDGIKPVKVVYRPAGRNTVGAYGVPQFSG